MVLVHYSSKELFASIYQVAISIDNVEKTASEGAEGTISVAQKINNITIK